MEGMLIRVFYLRGTGGEIMGDQKLLGLDSVRPRARDHEISQFRRRAPTDNLDRVEYWIN